MRMFEMQQQFGLDHVRMAERPIPVPGAGEVLVKLKAASLNSRDIGVIDGFYYPELTFPLIPVSDGVGEVVAMGTGVNQFRLGDRVCATFSQNWVSGEPTAAWLDGLLGGPRDGVLSEYIVLHEDGLVAVPEHLSDEEAATLPCAAVTAWQAVITEGKVQAGDTVVILGTGGVALFALQFAKLHGARVIITSSSDEKLERAKTIGADVGINYTKEPEWERRILELTNGKGADHIIELGGATLNRSVTAARTGGRISLIGLLSGSSVDEFQLIPTFQKKLTLQGINVGNRDMFEAMNRAITHAQLHPIVDRVFSFDQSIEALKYIASGSPFGKVCIRF